MRTDIATDRRANLIGSLWMVAAMAGFAVEDAMGKASALTLPVSEVLIVFGLGGAVIYALLALRAGDNLFAADVFSKPMRIRVGFEITGRLFYTLSYVLTPLSAATVILQATPLVVVAAAALIFGETVGWRRWSAILIGLIGVIIVINPGAESFSSLSILAVLGMLGFAGRDLASRAAPASLSTPVLGFWGFLAIVAAGVAFLIWDGSPLVRPDLATTGYLAGTIFAGVIGYSCLMKAMRTGEVSAVTPFRYTRLLFGIGLGVLWFGETLSTNTIVGSGLIVLSGLFILMRSKKRGAS